MDVRVLENDLDAAIRRLKALVEIGINVLDADTLDVLSVHFDVYIKVRGKVKGFDPDMDAERLHAWWLKYRAGLPS
jgi:hypothetical protein